MNTKRMKLTALRQAKGLSQLELAESIGVSRESISLWERGVADPHPSQVRRLCNYFEKEADELDLGTITAAPVIPAFSISMEEFLSQCSAALGGCWQLLQHAGFYTAENILMSYLPTLQAGATQPSPYQDVVAALATQAKILQCVLATHKLNYPGREMAVMEAVRFARMTQDRRLQAVSLMYQAYTYTWCYPIIPEKAIRLFTEALQCLDNDAYLLKSDIGIGLADAYAQANNETAALKAIETAQIAFPTYPEQDPSYTYADCTRSECYQWQGRMFLHLADNGRDPSYYQTAYNSFSTATSQQQSIGERSTSHSLILKADAARGMGDMEHYVECLGEGVRIALGIDSHKEYNTALTVFQKSPQSWRKEAKLKELQEIFQPGRI